MHNIDETSQQETSHIINELTNYNDYIGGETIKDEFKEFTFSSLDTNSKKKAICSKYAFDIKQAEEYCSTNIFVFNKHIIINLKKYFRNYVPKYASAFFNSNINGCLYIGVNDFGLVKGIPYCGKLNKEYLIKKLKKIIKNHLLHDSSYDIYNNIQIELIKIMKPTKPATDICPLFTHYLVEKQKHEDYHNNFIAKMDLWWKRFAFVNQKLIDLVNNQDSRILIINWIKTIDSSSSVIKLLETDFILEYRNHEEVFILKEDPTNPYYWVTRWKDIIIDTNKKERPVYNYEFNDCKLPINLIKNCNHMIPYWTNYNDDMNLYVICIKFISPNVTNKVLSYINKKKIYSCYRSVLHNGTPCCVPL